MKLKTLSKIAITAAILASSYAYAATKIYVTVYYTDATLSTWAGEAEETCNNGVISYGTVTAYSKKVFLGNCGSEGNR
jgi:hypothetical protein